MMTDSVLKVERTELAGRLDVGCKKSGMTPSILAQATRRIKLPLTESGKAKEEWLGRWDKGGPTAVSTTMFMSHPGEGAELAAGLTS